MRLKNTNGFSLLEAMLTIIVFSAIVGLAIPSFMIQLKRIKNQEAINLLTTLYEQQKDYYRQNDSYIDGMTTESSVKNALDVTIPTMQNFKSIEMHGGSDADVTCSGNTQRRLVTIIDNDSEYELMILENGRIVCQDVALSDCKSAICVKMGFPTDWQ